jgi:hypothetical protein
MAIARVEGGTIVETRDVDYAAIPQHKQHLWRPVVVEGNGPIERLTLDGDRVVCVRSIIPLADVKTSAKVSVSMEAEAERAKYITLGSGKAMSYQQVAAEARTYVTTNGAGVYPFLQARVSSGRYPDLAAAAAGTIAIEQQWATVGSAIDRLEDAAKLAIDAATTVEQVQAAATVTWPCP